MSEGSQVGNDTNPKGRAPRVEQTIVQSRRGQSRTIVVERGKSGRMAEASTRRPTPSEGILGSDSNVKIPEPLVKDRVDESPSFNQQIIMEWENERPRLQTFLKNPQSVGSFTPGFEGYGQAKINTDINYILRRKGEILQRNQGEQSKSDAGVICEYGIANLIRKEKILGDDVSVSLASQFDDYHGIDMLLHFADAQGDCYFAVDVKTALNADRNNAATSTAINGRERDFQAGVLKTVEYCLDPVTLLKTRILQTVSCVLVFDTEKMSALRNTFAKPKQLRIENVEVGPLRTKINERKLLDDVSRQFKQEIVRDCQWACAAIKVYQKVNPQNPQFKQLLDFYERIQKRFQ